ncbi:tumor necrosis factor receptor superfamily member 14-like [Triplophysa dalaica]|uniref:tumor necrosis factor receptor superfamily member 14-like n=1 Tax=Triplophysa dalaica TaxID=1582913 RepID=UPI0024E02E94|nr:tumor necrosis factor receptor superfamily member 14-like [Triplophysa dalaica]XP_056629115.1 tumor necrosis factor receptor superfamily member 14-like [Triplophysa dalaica]XP_056629116.1 tumor necrosis factor receptor superfamily member 14-like [Triplophysa dalaica]XP_056629117.1 tumor necrosis factor receptor superfamily member 14-like [Triplophysa dalaica]XP_056629118.1 tumor necrosis factor receptor superfamily member 14-like [Triplophysa dalaica]
MNMFLLGIILSIAALFALNFEVCFSTCARAEYQIEGECCPMCAPGNHVYWHCTEDTSTTCVPCPESTYTDEPNGLLKCLSCSVCDTAKGIRVRKGCTSTADVICEPQEGFYCIYRNKHICTLAVKHSKCSPGQYIKQTGTAFTDTLCANCTNGTYSNGTLSACQPHTKCDIKGLTEIEAGTTSTDAECGKSYTVGLTVGVAVGVPLMAVLVLFICWKSKRKKLYFDQRVQNAPQYEQNMT